MRISPALMLGATLAYLLTEVAFASYLVEFLGAAPSKDEILALERWGRTLTGMALALVLIPLVLPVLPVAGPAPWLTPAVGTAGVLALSIAVAQVGIDRLVQSLTDQTSAAERRMALIVNAGIGRIHAREDGQPALLVNQAFLPDALRDTVAGRFLLAGLPFLLARAEAIDQRLVAVLTEAVDRRIREEAGRPEALFNRTYVPLMEKAVIARYDGYVKAANEARRAMRDRIRQSDEDWQVYLRYLSLKGWNHVDVPNVPRQRSEASKQIRGQISFAPEGWVPRQREDFDDLYAGEIRTKYLSAVRSLDLVGPAVALENFDQTITPAQFVALLAVQATWQRDVAQQAGDAEFRERLAALGPQVGGSASVFPRFRAAVYEPVISAKVARETARLQSAVAAYGHGGAYAADAYDATKVMIIIPLALGFSTLGALTHAAKSLWLLSRVLGLPARTGVGLVGGFLVIVATASFWTRPGPVMNRPEVAAMFRGLSTWHAYGLRTAMVAQLVLYPSGLALRHAVGLAPPNPTEGRS